MKTPLSTLGCIACLTLFVAGARGGTLAFTIQTAGGTRPSLAFDANGRPAIAFANQYTAFDGTTWSAAQTAFATGGSAALAFNPVTGKPQIAFVDADGHLAFASRDGSWSVETVNVTDNFFDPSGRSPNLAIDATGKPHIGWGGPFNGNADYSYSTKDGANWITELVEGPGGTFSGEWSSLAINSAGIPAIIYNSHTNGGFGTYRGKYIIRAGGTWSAPEHAIVDVSSPGSALKFDPNNVPHVAYLDGNALKYATRDANGNWTAETAATAAGIDGFSLSLAIHPVNGVPYIAFRDALGENNAAVKVAHKTTGSWDVETIETGLGAFSTSAAIDAAGTTLGVAYNGKYAFAAITTDLTIVTGGTLPGGTLGRAYSRTFQRINGTAAFTWSKVSGDFPDGLTLNANTGELSGTPTTANQNASFRIRVTDGTSATAEKDFALAIKAAPAITANATLPEATLGLAYSQTVTVTDGTAPLAWSKATGALPDGVTLNTATGVLSGTPTAAGTFNFTVQVADANGATASKALSIVVNNALAITKTSPLPEATAGIAYSQTITTVGGTPPLVWTNTGNTLPAGLSLNTANGLVSGTTTATGMANFTVQVTDANNAKVTRDFALTVNVAPVITTASLPEGTVNLAYSHQATVSGGTAPRTWSKTGNLPAGLALNATGLIAGTPTASGTFNLTLRVTDQNGAFAERALALTIQAEPQGPNLSAGQTLHAQRCAGCHNTTSFPPRAGASKLILDSKGNHRNDALSLNDSSKTNIAFYLSSLDTQTYIINGVIKDAANQALEGATVTATSGYLPTRTAVSGANGTYSITGLAAGDYLVQASKSGVTFTPANVQLAVTKDKYWLGGNVLVTPDVQPLVPPINFTANQAPAVTLTSPGNNTAYLSPATIELSATASDPDGTVAGVSFYADGQLLGTDTTSPFSFTWNNVTTRTNAITAVATDNLGLSATTAAITLQVLNPVGVPGVNPAVGSAIYATKCAFCHGSPPGGNPTWTGIDPASPYVVGENSHPGILASRYRIGREFLDFPYHVPGISNYLAHVITESEKSDLAAYLSGQRPGRATVAGTVRNGAGAPVAGATVDIRSTYLPGVTVTTDAAGHYRVEGLFFGDYTLSAAAEGLDPFHPAAYALYFAADANPEQRYIYADLYRSIFITPSSASLAFTAGHRIQGSIRNASNRGFQGILVRAHRYDNALNRDIDASALSDTNGDFTLIVPDGEYTVSIAQGNYQPQPVYEYTFSPTSLSVTVAGGDQSGANFTVTAYPTLTISGKVTEPGGAGMGGVTVSLAEAPSITTTTDVNGDYTLTSPDPGTFTVTPAKAVHLFTPEIQVVTIGVGSRTNVNFNGILNSFYVSGTVRTRSLSSGPPLFNTIPGEPIPNVAISVPGQTVYTDAFGNYRLVLVNGNYTITAARSGYFFETPTRNVTVNGGSLTGEHFNGDLLVAYVSLGGNNNHDGSSWNSAKLSIQKAINVTAYGGEVWVSGGVYYERISFGGISLYGINKPVINGKPLPFGEQFTRGTVVKISTSIGVGTNGTRLDGFAIINGLATGSPNTGGGIHCTATDSEAGPVVIANNSIGENVAGFKGGGIFLIGKAAITNNVISGNSTEFGGGAGILVDFGSSDVTIANNLIVGNRADSGGGGIGAYANSIRIVNNTIVDNVATNSDAGGIYFGASFPPPGSSTNVNNIIAFNSSGIGPANNAVTNRHNCVFGNTNANYDGLTAGPGDVSVNPQFANPAEFNYRLLAASPLLNAGDNNYVVGVMDLDGAPRVEGATVDIGAYEYQAPNAAPEVALTSPITGASYHAPASFTMNALAADADGALVRVDFYAGQVLLGTVTSPPFAFSLNGLQVGTHVLTAAATDNRGARTVSAPVTVTVHPATDPVVAITSPLEGIRVAAPAQITIQANASDSDGSITNVEFFVNGAKVGEDSSAPYSFVWSNVAAGAYTLTVKAADNSNATTTSTPVNITVVNPPQILQTDTVYTGGEFRLPMMLETGRSYLIQASTDLVTWTTLEAFTAFGNALEFVDTQAGNYPGRFYRIVLAE